MLVSIILSFEWSLPNCLFAHFYLRSVSLSTCLRCCDFGEDARLMTDQGIQTGDIPPGEQIHPGPEVKNAALRDCSAADEWSYLSCHQGSAREVTAQLYLVSGADACTPLPFMRKGTKKKRGRDREDSCPIKHFSGPSRAHLTSHHPAVLLP